MKAKHRIFIRIKIRTKIARSSLFLSLMYYFHIIYMMACDPATPLWPLAWPRLNISSRTIPYLYQSTTIYFNVNTTRSVFVYVPALRFPPIPFDILQFFFFHSFLLFYSFVRAKSTSLGHRLRVSRTSYIQSYTHS